MKIKRVMAKEQKENETAAASTPLFFIGKALAITTYRLIPPYESAIAAVD